MATMITMATIRKLEVVHQELGGCLISYDIQHAYTGKLGVHHHYSVSPICRYRAALAAKNVVDGIRAKVTTDHCEVTPCFR